ncbi:reverse transcriptase domain-containing protein [Tanacetum coccineum]
MMGPTPDLITPSGQVITNVNSDTPNLQEQILNQLSSLKALVKLHNGTPSGKVTSHGLSFGDKPGPDPPGGPEVEELKGRDEDLRKPHKEILKSPLSRSMTNGMSFEKSLWETRSALEEMLQEPLKATRIIKTGERKPPYFKNVGSGDELQTRWYSGSEHYFVGNDSAGCGFGTEGLTGWMMMKFTVVRAASPYNIIIGRTRMRDLRAVSSTIHAMVKFPTPRGIATLIARTAPKVTIGTQFSPDCRLQLINLLKNNMDVFAWEPSDMVGVPKRIAKHTLNVNPSITPVAQKRRMLGSEKSQAVLKEVQEWLKADIIRPVKYPTWISNPVLVKKVDDTWRMCIDFKNLNSACPKDFYPLPEIDLKIEAVMGFPFKCFLDAYKGYHQIQMDEEDEEKTAFYTDQGTYCYTKMPFGLKNAGATYQRVVDSAFQTQLGRNLEAYVDDMVIKSKTERDMIMDIAETFHNLRKINMKLNPKKCSFGVAEGKFLGYMVTSEGIRANPKR